MKHIHILGICGTFMGSLAQMAIAQGYRVTGCDTHVYPPMSTQLEQAGIELIEGYDIQQLALKPDLVIIGNAMSRGNPLVEAVLNQGIPYQSGPQWLCEAVLKDRWVCAVSGTHGKTTTSSMLAWILEYAGMKPGFLIGGVPSNFAVSARLGKSQFFVVEADEYDSAFFDKRSKFIHYQPRTLVINNIEFDHADIFANLDAIETQFHHLVRTVPSEGLIIHPQGTDSIQRVLDRGCWTPTVCFSVNEQNDTDWNAELENKDGSRFSIYTADKEIVTVQWSLNGLHNVNNGLAALMAAHHVGVKTDIAAEALSNFAGVKRRMECLGTITGKVVNNVTVYDDFAHHPSAIATTLQGLRAKVNKERIIAIIEPRSNTMRMGVHQKALAEACQAADNVLWLATDDLNWNIASVIEQSKKLGIVGKSINSIDGIITEVSKLLSDPCHIIVMSNGSFAGIHQRLLNHFNALNH